MPHTPGPWKVVRNIVRGGGCRIDSGQYCETVAESVLEQNAHLVAAAPDMLAALKAVQRVEHIADIDRANKAESDAAILVEEAIDKAEGR